MLAITEQTILLIRAGQRRHDTNRFNERMDRPKPRTRQLNQDRRRHLIEGTAYLLKTGQPTRFAFEGACRTGLRSTLCLQGWSWHDADAAAAEVVAAALAQIGAVRPTYQQAQPEWTEEGFSPIRRTRCRRCCGKLPADSDASFCSTVCRSIHYAENAGKFGETQDRATWIACRQAETVARRQQREVACEQCKKPFLIKRPGAQQRFCSHDCASKSRIAARPKQQCASCRGAIEFSGRPSSAPKMCQACRTARPWMKPIQERACPICEKRFRPSKRASEGQIYCSLTCKGKASRLPPKQCENCQTYFQPVRGEARFCCNRCSALARSRAIREASAFRCEAAE